MLVLAGLVICVISMNYKPERLVLFGSEPARIQLTVPKQPENKWMEPYFTECSKYDVTISPEKEEIYPIDPACSALGAQANQGCQCPDSSFTFVDDLSRFVPGAPAVPSCIQLKDIPYCYSLPNGKYKPNTIHLKQVSP